MRVGAALTMALGAASMAGALIPLSLPKGEGTGREATFRVRRPGTAFRSEPASVGANKIVTSVTSQTGIGTLSSEKRARTSVIYTPLRQGQTSGSSGKLSFSRDIMPILADKCFKCHGPDSETRMAGLRLDTPESVFAKRSGNPVIAPNHPERSVLVARIERREMPPPDSGKSLTNAEIATLRTWIAQGAPYGKLWSFEPLPKAIPVPSVSDAWVRDDLDRFVLARLRANHLRPSRPADPLRWLRRVTYDLTGLPLSASDIATFTSDVSPKRFEHAVDRLLASPHYGEKLAVDWLDAARYSDSYGYQSDLLMPVWPYRDWVIRAFNANMPYRRFLVDQIAGDLLPNATRDERLATAFNRLHRQSNEGGSIPLEFKTEYAADRVATYGSAVLGLTLGCARCHDHKFDPITQKEYYQLFAYFNSIKESGLLLSTEVVPTPSLLLPSPDQEKKLRELRADAELTRRAAREQMQPTSSTLLLDAKFGFAHETNGHFANEVAGAAEAIKLGKIDTEVGPHGPALKFDGDNGLAIHGLVAQDRWDPFTWSFWVKDPREVNGQCVLLHRTGGTDVGFCGFDLILEDGHLTARVMRHWPGNGIGVRTVSAIPKGQWTHVAWSWDGMGDATGLKVYIDGELAKTEVLNDRIWKRIHAYGDLGDSHGDWAFGQRFREAGFRGGEVSEVAYAEHALSGLEIELLAHRPVTANPRDNNLSALDDAYRQRAQKAREAQRALAEFEDGIYEVPVMEESPTEIPAYQLARGNYDAPRNDQTRVHRDVPSCFPRLVEGSDQKIKNDRLALAEWTVRDDNPLTARVAVNRIWQMLFGTGLVETSENLGVQGSRPKNRELLDYLALQFVDSGWNVKALVRRIVLSATYRQDSVLTPELKAKDPENQLLSRGPSHRLSAEEIRDTALQAAGLMNGTMFGTPVNPYQPAGIWQENNTMSPGFVQSKGADLYRRSIYSTWKRTTPVPSMMLFDATSREACAIRRQVTNTPLQALVLLNDVQFVEAARVLAQNVIGERPSDKERVELAFARLSGRSATAPEMKILLAALADQREQFRADPTSANKLIHAGESPIEAKIDPVELAAMTAVVQIVMNSDCVVWER